MSVEIIAKLSDELGISPDKARMILLHYADQYTRDNDIINYILSYLRSVTRNNQLPGLSTTQPNQMPPLEPIYQGQLPPRRGIGQPTEAYEEMLRRWREAPRIPLGPQQPDPRIIPYNTVQRGLPPGMFMLNSADQMGGMMPQMPPMAQGMQQSMAQKPNIQQLMQKLPFPKEQLPMIIQQLKKMYAETKDPIFKAMLELLTQQKVDQYEPSEGGEETPEEEKSIWETPWFTTPYGLMAITNLIMDPIWWAIILRGQKQTAVALARAAAANAASTGGATAGAGLMPGPQGPMSVPAGTPGSIPIGGTSTQIPFGYSPIPGSAGGYYYNPPVPGGTLPQPPAGYQWEIPFGYGQPYRLMPTGATPTPTVPTAPPTAGMTSPSQATSAAGYRPGITEGTGANRVTIGPGPTGGQWEGGLPSTRPTPTGLAFERPPTYVPGQGYVAGSTSPLAGTGVGGTGLSASELAASGLRAIGTTGEVGSVYTPGGLGAGLAGSLAVAIPTAIASYYLQKAITEGTQNLPTYGQSLVPREASTGEEALYFLGSMLGPLNPVANPYTTGQYLNNWTGPVYNTTTPATSTSYWLTPTEKYSSMLHY